MSTSPTRGGAARAARRRAACAALVPLLFTAPFAACVAVANREAASPAAREAYDDWGGGGFAENQRGLLALDAEASRRSDTLAAAHGGETPTPDGTTQEPAPTGRTLVYTGALGLAVPDPEVAIERAKAIAAELEGYVEWIVDASVQLRIPATRWEDALARSRALGIVTSRRVEIRDVGKQLVDLELRLKNQRALLERLRALLEKAEDVKAALEVERELARVQTEVEQIEAQLLKLRQQVAFSTLTLAFQRTVTSPQARRHLPFPWIHQLGLPSLLGREVMR